MTTHLHIQIQQLYQLYHCNDTQVREAITEEINRLIRKLNEYLNWASPWAAAVGQQLVVINGSALTGGPFRSPLNKGYLRPHSSLWNTCENSSKGRRCGPRNPTTFPLEEEHVPLQEVSVAALQTAALCRPLLACPARLPAQLPCRNSPPGKAQGKCRHGHMLHKPFSSFRN